MPELHALEGELALRWFSPWSFYRNYSPGMLRLKDANIGSVAFKNAKVFNSIQVPIGFQLIPP
jgi:hypothetical protein